MLQTAALVAVPVLVGALTAAFFIMRSLNKETNSQQGPQPPSGFQTHPVNQRRPGDSQSRRRRRTAKDNLDTECVICFEDRPLVELYPCQHRNMCEHCVLRWISTNKSACPLCRRRIQGYH